MNTTEIKKELYKQKPIAETDVIIKTSNLGYDFFQENLLHLALQSGDELKNKTNN